MLLVVTVRPELQPTWVGQPHVRMLPLSRLGRGDSTGIIAGIAKDEAAEHFRRGIGVAGQQGSKMLGLRVTTSLARLLAEDGRTEEARNMLLKALSPICGGADTPDPKNARDLLRQLK